MRATVSAIGILKTMLTLAAVLTSLNTAVAEGAGPGSVPGSGSGSGPGSVPGRAVETVTRRVVVSIPDRKLALIENDRLVSVYPVAVGAPASPSPVGTFTVVNRVPNPTYYRPGKVVGPGATNPIGTRWIGLNEKGYGIHGTDDPKSIGFAKSHGCIRLKNGDIERLFERVRAGDIVELHAERTPETAKLFKDLQ